MINILVFLPWCLLLLTSILLFSKKEALSEEMCPLDRLFPDIHSALCFLHPGVLGFYVIPYSHSLIASATSSCLVRFCSSL